MSALGLILNLSFVVFAMVLSLKFKRNPLLWSALCFFFPVAVIILIQLGHRECPGIAVNLKKIVVRILIALVILIATAFISNYPFDNDLRNIEAGLLAAMLGPPVMSDGFLVIGERAVFGVPSGVLNTVVAVGAWGFIFSLFISKPGAMKIKITGTAFLLGIVAKLVKDFFYCLFLFDGPGLVNQTHYDQFTKAGMLLALFVLLWLTVGFVLTGKEKSNV